MRIAINDKNFIEYSNTPWNDNVLGFSSNEIVDYKFTDKKYITELFDLFEADSASNGCKLTTCRFDANDHFAKASFTEQGFYFAEASYKVIKSLNNIEKFKNKLPKLSCTVTAENMSDLSEEDIQELKKIAHSQFDHGRFAEDYNLGKLLSDKRNANWINNMVVDKNEVTILRFNNSIAGFMAFKSENQTAYLLLGGLTENYRLYAYGFWFETLISLKDKGVTRVETIISAANINAMNVYSFFDFKFYKLLFGYHKIRDQK